MSDLQQAVLGTPVGPIVVTVGSAGVCQVSWVSPGVPPVVDLPGTPTGADDVLTEAVTQLTEYFAGSRREFSMPVDLAAVAPTARDVLLALQQVPYGTSITYGALAELSGTGLPARAIGSVMGANPVPILIPCHRVLAGDGLGGYSGGLPGQGVETKRWLLELEGALQSRLW
ncbi:MAG: methylated-DNA--[protein]-cysteine S-methyltransferase [Microlunatus sp.]